MEWLLAILVTLIAWFLPDTIKKIESSKAESKHRGTVEDLAQKLKSGIEAKSTIKYGGNTEVAIINFSGSFNVAISKNGQPETTSSFSTIYELDDFLTNSTRFRVGDFI